MARRKIKKKKNRLTKKCGERADGTGLKKIVDTEDARTDDERWMVAEKSN